MKGSYFLHLILGIIIIILLINFIPWKPIFDWIWWALGYQDINIVGGRYTIGIILSILIGAATGDLSENSRKGFITFIIVMSLICPDLVIAGLIIWGLYLLYTKILIPFFDKHLTI